MSIDELVRSELHAVAEQVVVPPMPSLEEPRRSWRPVVAAAAAVALVIGGVTYLARDRSEPPARPIEKPKVDPPEPLRLDTSAPTIPWIEGHRLRVGGQRVPGTWVEVYSSGDTWLAHRSDNRVFWGRGTTEAHALGRSPFPLWYDGPYLSRNGSYVAAGIYSATVVDTRTGQSRAVRFPGPVSETTLAGVTDDGVALAGNVHGTFAFAPQGPPVKLQVGSDHVVRTNDSGLLVEDRRGRVWVADLVGTELRRVALVLGATAGGETSWGTEASLSSDRRWLLDRQWALDRKEPARLPITAVDDGRSAPVTAPAGWRFAPQLAPGFWEPEGTLVTFVVQPDSRAYRTARCAPATGECVLLEEP